MLRKSYSVSCWMPRKSIRIRPNLYDCSSPSSFLLSQKGRSLAALDFSVLMFHNSGMAKVRVFKVTVYDITTDEQRVSRRMATAEGVAIMRGTIIENTGVEMDESQLERGEKWTPIDFKP
jgi:hypothetical protein